jgi:ABC-type Fe3+/spermidine/putrescine transport system ATPase subunit
VADFIGRMNLFEGRVLVVEGGALVVEAAGLGRIDLPRQGAAEGAIGVAVRPEKTRLAVTRPPDGTLALPATVSQIAYHGSESHVFLVTDEGLRVAATLHNDSRASVGGPAIGERLWVSWAPEDTLVLVE